MTAHELAALLLQGPDLPVCYLDTDWGPTEVLMAAKNTSEFIATEYIELSDGEEL